MKYASGNKHLCFIELKKASWKRDFSPSYTYATPSVHIVFTELILKRDNSRLDTKEKCPYVLNKASIEISLVIYCRLGVPS